MKKEKQEQKQNKVEEGTDINNKQTELSDEDLDQVPGGTGNVTMNRAKTADKAFNAMSDYIKQ